MFALDTTRFFERTAFLFAETGLGVSYAELSRQVDASKRRLLAELGLSQAELDASRGEAGNSPLQAYRPLVPEPTLESLIELLAHLELGVPVLLLDARCPQPERERVLAEIDGKVPEPDDRIVLATSGSTGRPKLVVHTEASLLAAAWASEQNLGWLPEGDRWHLALPLCHVGGLALVVRCVLARQTIVVGHARSSDAEAVVAELERHQVTLASFVPTQLARILSHIPAAGMPTLRAALVGGAPTAPELRLRAAERGLRLLTTYGMTEMSSQVATERWPSPTVASGSNRAPTPPRANSSPGLEQSGLVGPPLPGVKLRFDSAGRIAVFGPMAMRAYLNAPSPFDADGYLITNDLGRIDADGNLHVLGRSDNVILTGGENVSPESVEAALLSHPHVKEACVVGIPDPDWGSRVVAALVAEKEIPAEVLLAHAARLLPKFAIPKQFRILPALPHLPSGKLDRTKIRQSWLRGELPGPP